MSIKIGAFGYGVASLLTVGAIFLAAIGKSEWKTFLFFGLAIWITSVLLKRI